MDKARRTIIGVAIALLLPALLFFASVTIFPGGGSYYDPGYYSYDQAPVGANVISYRALLVLAVSTLIILSALLVLHIPELVFGLLAGACFGLLGSVYALMINTENKARLSEMVVLLSFALITTAFYFIDRALSKREPLIAPQPTPGKAPPAPPESSIPTQSL